MKKTSFAVLILAAGFSFGAAQANAQGPAGAGATAAASSSSSSSGGSHSMNPIKWMKKDKSSANSVPSADQNKRLTARLQQSGVLAAGGDVSTACATFKNLSDCVAALHASHNTGLDFNCVRADVTGVQTSADLSSCKGTIGDKAVNLEKALKRLKPEVDAKAEAKSAEKQAKDDLKETKA
jgi:hypothetical protein